MILHTIHVTVDRKLNIRNFVAALLALGLSQSPAWRFGTHYPICCMIQLSDPAVETERFRQHLKMHLFAVITYYLFYTHSVLYIMHKIVQYKAQVLVNL